MGYVVFYCSEGCEVHDMPYVFNVTSTAGDEDELAAWWNKWMGGMAPGSRGVMLAASNDPDIMGTNSQFERWSMMAKLGCPGRAADRVAGRVYGLAAGSLLQSIAPVKKRRQPDLPAEIWQPPADPARAWAAVVSMCGGMRRE